MIQPWFPDAKLGIFIHWGIYAVNGIDESWAFFNGHISHVDYMRQLDGFTASKWDAGAWASLFRRSGARYAVLTSKHHDGVALWDTQQVTPTLSAKGWGMRTRRCRSACRDDARADATSCAIMRTPCATRG